MKTKRMLVVFISLIFILVTFTACGGNSSSEQVSSDQQVSGNVTGSQSDTDAQAVANQDVPVPDPKVSADGLIGSGTDISSPDRFITIVKSGEEYQVEDNEGKYPGTFKDGVLSIQVTDLDKAEIFVDPKSGHLFSFFQYNQTEYKKK
jgi:hypothetical protein